MSAPGAGMRARRGFAVLAALGGVALLVWGAGHGGGAAAGAPRGDAASCLRANGLPQGFAQQDRRAGMARVPAGVFEPGSRNGYPDESPPGPVRVQAFWIDRTEVTNAQFTRFVAATGHVTQAERENAAAVFRAPAPGHAGGRPSDWWAWTPGANWRHPEGPGSTLEGRENQPVVHVTHADAMAYARWLGRDLPSEAEWEYAARGGGSAELVDREPRDPAGKPVANYWQGIFPDLNTGEDGYAALAPVGCFAANGYGLHDMVGNAWELTRDRYTANRQPSHANGQPAEAVVQAGGTPRQGERMVIKGGSFLCAANYCVRYRAAAREAHEADMAASHVGFRTVLRE